MAVLLPNMTVFSIKYKTRVFKIRGRDINCNNDNNAFDEDTYRFQPVRKTVKISLQNCHGNRGGNEERKGMCSGTWRRSVMQREASE